MVKFHLSLFLFLCSTCLIGAEEFLNPHLPIISKTIHGKAVMRVECSQVKKQVKSLRAWTKRVEGRSCLEPKQRINYSGHCLLDISDCLPRKVLAVHKLTTAGDGPNCWNTSLVMQKALPHLRESSSFEFETFIRSPFCKEILLPQLLKPGDIGAIEASLGNDLNYHYHSFIFINSRLVFQKLGLAQVSGFELTSFREMQKKYPLELTGQCKNECSLKIDFEDILPEADVEKLEKDYPTLKIPDPRYFCRSFHKENKPSLEVLYSIFNEEIPNFSKGDFEVITRILFKGCEAFKERANLIKGTISACQRMCPTPRLRYYRCEEPMKFYRRVSSQSATLLKDLNQILQPLEGEIEKEFVNGGDKVESIKKNYRETILKVRDYLAFQKIKPKKLKGHEKHVLALVGVRLLEMGVHLKEVGYFELQMNDFYILSKDFGDGVEGH